VDREARGLRLEAPPTPGCRSASAPTLERMRASRSSASPDGGVGGAPANPGGRSAPWLPKTSNSRTGSIRRTSEAARPETTTTE
jgi:hypothetical protein